ncbi:hypothetical protein C7H85_03255 [Zobellella endophytica]|uniref:DUF2523 domain-containing protein n=1 Tax=Zobellella endophytica TaxID=2116700 RepID=A0A2P7RC96_9GAMM|nr:DUF2523 domain-containing protein [Zobellella endophytica]PSJ47845.1 hypothetical protein C7H85_03255 [Zobellella endophytica]
MPFVSAILLGLLTFVGESITRFLVSAGAFFVVYTGVAALSQGLIELSQGYWAGIPGHILQIMALGGLDEALSILMSAVATRFAMDFTDEKIMSFRAAK